MPATIARSKRVRSSGSSVPQTGQACLLQFPIKILKWVAEIVLLFVSVILGNVLIDAE
jgi:hypothetical protein